MKRILLLICTFTSHFLLFGQDNTRTVTAPSHPTQEINTYTAQQEFDLAKQIPKDIITTPNVTPSTFSLADRNNPSLSAEGSAAVRFKDVPVNLATGAMNLPIPIYTLSEGLLSVPISLDFNGSGMKNQEVASWCGAGWNLNAGGMISRMVRGLPDEGVKIVLLISEVILNLDLVVMVLQLTMTPNPTFSSSTSMVLLTK